MSSSGFIRKYLLPSVPLFYIVSFVVGPFIPGQYKITPDVDTVRIKELEKLRGKIESTGKDRLIVVQGPMGFGKTTLVDNAIAPYPAVRVKIRPGLDSDEIDNLAYDEIAGPLFKYFNPFGYWKYVVWVNTLFRKKKFIVVLNGKTRYSLDGKAANLAQAARDLSDNTNGKIVVIIDASDNAIGKDFKPNSRDTNFSLGPLMKEEVLSLPQYKEINEKLQLTDVADDAYAVLGGSPLLWDKFRSFDGLEGVNHEEIVKASHEYLRDVVNSNEGLPAVTDFVNEYGKEFAKSGRISLVDVEKRKEELIKAIYSEFALKDNQVKKSTAFDNFAGKGYIVQPNKVLRQIGSDYSPHTPVIAFILRHGIKHKISTEELKQYIQKDKDAGITLQ